MAKFVHGVLHFELLKPFNIFDFPPLLRVLVGFQKRRSSEKKKKKTSLQWLPIHLCRKAIALFRQLHGLLFGHAISLKGSKGQKMETKKRGSRVARVLGPKWGGNHHIWLTHDKIIKSVTIDWEGIYVCWCHQTLMAPSCATNAYY